MSLSLEVKSWLYPDTHFALFRVIFGLFLFIYFARLLPYGTEIYSAEGMLADPSLNYTYPFMPPLLASFDSPWQISGLLIAAALGSLMLMMGFYRRIAAGVVWLIFISLALRNNLTLHVAYNYIGWLLLVCLAVPEGEKWSIKPTRNKPWELPPLLIWGAWSIAGLSYTMSGWLKHKNPLWSDGSALQYILEGPLVRSHAMATFLLEWPFVLKLGTWISLWAELIFFFMIFRVETRAIIWFILVCMHLGIFLLLDLRDLPIAILIFHFFLFEYRWLVLAKQGWERWKSCRWNDSY